MKHGERLSKSKRTTTRNNRGAREVGFGLTEFERPGVGESQPSLE